jgi:hypothetical protein
MSKSKKTENQDKQQSKDELGPTDDRRKPAAEHVEDKKALSMKDILEAREGQRYQQQQE